MNYPQKIYKRVYLHLPVLLIAAGLILRIKYWFENRSLWLDEAYLGLHLLTQSWKDILVNRQLAVDLPVPPMGFMLMEKICGSVFGYQEMALRVFPLVCGITAMLLFYVLARRILSLRAMFFALALFVFNNFLIDYAVELKQYSTDVMVFLALSLLFLLKTDDDYAIKMKDAPLFAVAGALALTFSHPAIFILAAFGVVQQITLLSRRKINEAKIGLVCGFYWAAVFLFWYLTSYRVMSHDPGLVSTVWKPGYMMNVPFWSWAGAGWYGKKLINIVSRVAGLRPFFAALLFLLAGMACLSKRNKKVFLILFSPLLLALAAAGLKKYLLGDRFSLFMVPAVFIAVAYGLDAVCRRLGKRGTVLFGLIIIIFLSGVLPQTWTYFLRGRPKEESRDNAFYLQSDFREGDVLIVNESGYFALFFYFARNGRFQLPGFYVVSDRPQIDSKGSLTGIRVSFFRPSYDRRGYLNGIAEFPKPRELFMKQNSDRRQINRIWFFGAHLKGSEKFILDFFAARGYPPSIDFHPHGAVLMRFDLRSKGADT